MVEKYLRSICKAARSRLALLRQQMAEHAGRGLMTVHYDWGYHIFVVPKSFHMEKGQLVFPCSKHVDYERDRNPCWRNALQEGRLLFDEAETHSIFFPDGSDRRTFNFHIGDAAFLAWYAMFGALSAYPESIKIAKELGHTFRVEDLATYRLKYEQAVASQARSCADRACVSAHGLYTGASNRTEKERLHRELGATRNELEGLLKVAEAAGLDPVVLNGHREHYRERLATYD